MILSEHIPCRFKFVWMVIEIVLGVLKLISELVVWVSFWVSAGLGLG